MQEHECQAYKHRYYWITQAFESTSGSISNLVNGINQMKDTCSDTTLLGSFLENHDQPRFASYTSDYSLAKNAIAFSILQDGIPIGKSTRSMANHP
jgi:alpha-amylase